MEYTSMFTENKPWFVILMGASFVLMIVSLTIQLIPISNLSLLITSSGFFIVGFSAYAGNTETTYYKGELRIKKKNSIDDTSFQFAAFGFIVAIIGIVLMFFN